MGNTRWSTALTGLLALAGAALGCSDAQPDGGLGSANAGSGSEAGRSGAGAGSAGTNTGGGSGAAGSGAAGGGGSGGSAAQGMRCGATRCAPGLECCDVCTGFCVSPLSGAACPNSSPTSECGGAVDAGVGIVLPACAGSNMSAGTSCSGRDDQPVPECCQGDGMHLRCAFTVCTASIPANCSGSFEAVPGSTLCGGYQACAAKSCGDACTECDPADCNCMETDVVRTCDRSGRCATGNADCSQPMSCDPFGGVDPCPMGEACCEVGRCGPVGTSDGVCEPADPTTGDCMPCACEMQPGGCPRCNAPDTPILTPDGERAIASLREGDLVMSLHGGRLIAVPIARTRQMRVANHAVVRLWLDDAEPIEVSGSHPTADGRRLDSLQPGDVIGARTVSAIELVPYTLDRTYDILPASDSGTYLAGGALLGSTLWVAPRD